ncbi:ABC-F family ATP-binding cassette domain-containing protein [Candidatus Cloacimonadota bacterium]
MSLITLIDVSHNFGDQDIFRNVNFTVEKNSRIGLVGVNGSGKTTLFNILTRHITPHSGKVLSAKKLKIAYLSQEVDLPDNDRLYDTVLGSRPDYIELKEKLDKAEFDLEKNNSPDNLKKYSSLREQFEAIDGFSYEIEIKLVLTSLNFPLEVWNNRIGKFSGGEKTRIQLAKFLLQPYDLMLLDEPTNHLDIKMIIWLEKFLTNRSKPYIIISHDRYFLDNTIKKIVEIDQYKINTFHTNFTNYRKEKEQRYEVQMKEYKRQQEFIKNTEDFIQRNMAGQKVLQAKSRQKMLKRLDVIEKPSNQKEIKLNLKSEKRSGNDVYIFKDMSFGFNNKPLVKNIDLRLAYQDKVAVLGHNGCGKTTLLRLMKGELEPLSGIARKGASLDIGYYDQLHLSLDESKSVLRTIWDLTPGEPQGYPLSYLARFGFRGDDVEKSVSTLSGGEKSRLYLAKLIHQKPNFLILDEPTNHLDIFMIPSLVKALQEYDGTVVFVSHDRYFVNQVSTKRWFFNQDKSIIETKQSLEELFFQKLYTTRKRTYEKKREKRINPHILNTKMAEIEEVHNNLGKLKQDLCRQEEKLADPDSYKNQYILKPLTNKIKDLKAEIDRLEETLFQLEEEYLELAE